MSLSASSYKGRPIASCVTPARTGMIPQDGDELELCTVFILSRCLRSISCDELLNDLGVGAGACAVEAGTSTSGRAGDLGEVLAEARASVGSRQVLSADADQIVGFAEVVAGRVARNQPPTNIVQGPNDVYLFIELCVVKSLVVQSVYV